MLSTVRTIRDRITTEVIEAGGNSCESSGIIYVCIKAPGLPHFAHKSDALGDEDIPSIQTYFRQKIKDRKEHYQKAKLRLEIWAVEVFRDMHDEEN